MHDLIRISIPRLNFIPILADAMHPNSYKNMVSQVDFLYQDIAQREQARIAIRNAGLFLKKDGNYSENMNVMIRSMDRNRMRMTINSTDHAGRFFMMNLDTMLGGHEPPKAALWGLASTYREAIRVVWESRTVRFRH